MIIKNEKSLKKTEQKKARMTRTQNSLILPTTYRRNPNYEFIKNNLINSKRFSKIEYQKLPTAKHKQTIKVNGITCLFDGIDSPKVNLDEVQSDKIFEDIDFYFPLQFCSGKTEHYKYISEKSGIKIFPLIYGTSGLFPIGQFNWRKTNHKYLAHFGFGLNKVQRHRKKWVAKAKQNGHYIVKYMSGKKFSETLKDCRWGVSLKGAGFQDDGKCYREAEFLSCGMPLALNYQPTYAFPFFPNVHYLYLDNPGKLDSLGDIDPEPFANRSKTLWKSYYCPKTFTNLFLSILYDENYRNLIPKCWPGSRILKSPINLKKTRCKING